MCVLRERGIQIIAKKKNYTRASVKPSDETEMGDGAIYGMKPKDADMVQQRRERFGH